MRRSANEGRGYESPIREPARDLHAIAATMTEWLAHRVGDTALRVVEVESPKTSGVANETLLLKTAEARPPSYVMRLENERPLFIDRPIRTQYLMHEALAEEPTVPAPAPVGYEADADIVGTPFFVTEFVPGLVPGDRPHFSEAGFVHDASVEQRRQLWENSVDALVRLHRVRPDRFEFLADDDRSGLDRELGYWRRYTDQLDVEPSWNHDMLEEAWTWLGTHRPDPVPTALSWGDARIGNMIFRDYSVVALLDWDTVSLAGPEADLAWWIQMDRHSWELLPGLGTPDELVARWEAGVGRRARHLHWHLVFTAYRLGVIRMKLRRMMVADGMLPEFEGSADAPNESIQLMALWLGERPRGGSSVRKPPVRDR